VRFDVCQLQLGGRREIKLAILETLIFYLRIWQFVKQILNITTTDTITYIVQLLEKLKPK